MKPCKMDVEIPVFAGYLNVPTQSGFSLNRISKKKSSQRYCLLFKSSCHGIQRLEICETKEDKNPKIITLENCVKITQEPSPANQIQIVKKTGTLTLNTLTNEDLKEWVNALQTVAFPEKKNALSSRAVIEEDNDLYCSSFGDGLFIITLIPSETSMRCNIEPKTYMLNMTATELQLKSAKDLSFVIAKWPYRFIRKYGYRDGKFTFEAGRKCTTGEGVFTLEHTNPQEVFRCMSSKMKSMKKMISGENLNSIECGENVLSVAASMEAGSRSPLPPSPSNQHPVDLETNSTQSCISMRGFISSSDSLNNFSVNSNSSICSAGTPLTSIKHIPNKPPRKLPSSLDKIASPSTLSSPVSPNSPPVFEIKSGNYMYADKLKHFQNYEPVSITTSTDPNKTAGSTVIIKPSSPDAQRKINITADLTVRNDHGKTVVPNTDREYECIETITDAWKTMGVCDVRHTERLTGNNNDDDFIDSIWQRSLSQRDKTPVKESFLPVKTPTIVDIDIGESSASLSATLTTDATYDRLDFLSPNNKASSDYKTIVTVSPSTSRVRCSPPPTNDYESIASPDIQPSRKADDSHLGYGVLRKSNFGNKPAILNNNNHTGSTTCFSESPVAPKATNKMNNQAVDHRTYNGLNYTIVSKPKKV